MKTIYDIFPDHDCEIEGCPKPDKSLLKFGEPISKESDGNHMKMGEVAMRLLWDEQPSGVRNEYLRRAPTITPQRYAQLASLFLSPGETPPEDSETPSNATKQFEWGHKLS